MGCRAAELESFWEWQATCINTGMNPKMKRPILQLDGLRFFDFGTLLMPAAQTREDVAAWVAHLKARRAQG